MPKMTRLDLLRELRNMEKMFKSSDVRPQKKTQLNHLQEIRQSETGNIVTEFQNIHAILPELIASVSRNKDLDRAAFYVGLLYGIFIGLGVSPESTDDEPKKISPAMAARLQSNKSQTFH